MIPYTEGVCLRYFSSGVNVARFANNKLPEQGRWASRIFFANNFLGVA